MTIYQICKKKKGHLKQIWTGASVLAEGLGRGQTVWTSVVFQYSGKRTAHTAALRG